MEESEEKDIASRFKKASAKMHAAVQNHVKKYESSSSEDEYQDEGIVLSSVLTSFSQVAGEQVALGRTQHYLEQLLREGTAVCLICIGVAKRADAIWNCDSCYTFFHLVCIQRWAKNKISQEKETASDPMIPNFARPLFKIEWCCPNCRFNYGADCIPNQYTCFCKKEVNPRNDLWLIPHSCGEICGKLLLPLCEHTCMLLCHPGPCPPCPQMVNKKCNCGQSPVMSVRCSSQNFSCGKICDQLLSCKTHRCKELCHPGDCASCLEKSVQFCVCSKSTAERPCSETVWNCTIVCGKQLDCGYHKCDIVCHSMSECWKCPFSGIKHCPCRSTKMTVICPNEVPCCGDTCKKNLPCGMHSCPNKCHKDECPPCLVVINKSCRCGLHRKEIPCSKEFTCSTKCGKLKDCGRHLCAKKCCPNSCTPCDKPCQRALQCAQHKCSSACHTGPCFPCPVMKRVSCKCGFTFVTVPCGRERKTRPPQCSRICKASIVCNHVNQNKHSCHSGPCPQCKQICGAKLNCGHQCKQLCHAAVPIVENPTLKPATPWEVQAPKIRITKQPCPPCMALIPILCMGGHDTAMQHCSMIHLVSCGSQCGRKLKCDNHYCQLICHPITQSTTRMDEEFLNDARGCEKCNKACQKPRPTLCRHTCSTGYCHPSECPPCQKITRLRCHCGVTEHFLRCNIITENENHPDAKEKMLSCGDQCVKLLKCGHRCYNVCHSGDCPTEQNCTRKVKLHCSCRQIKKEVVCSAVMAIGVNLLECGEVCEAKRIEVEAAEREKYLHMKQEEERKNEKEVEEFKRKFSKKKYKEYKTNEVDIRRPFWKSWWILCIIPIILSMLVIPIYYFK